MVLAVYYSPPSATTGKSSSQGRVLGDTPIVCTPTMLWCSCSSGYSITERSSRLIHQARRWLQITWVRLEFKYVVKDALHFSLRKHAHNRQRAIVNSTEMTSASFFTKCGVPEWKILYVIVPSWKKRVGRALLKKIVLTTGHHTSKKVRNCTSFYCKQGRECMMLHNSSWLSGANRSIITKTIERKTKTHQHLLPSQLKNGTAATTRKKAIASWWRQASAF